MSTVVTATVTCSDAAKDQLFRSGERLVVKIHTISHIHAATIFASWTRLAPDSFLKLPFQKLTQTHRKCHRHSLLPPFHLHWMLVWHLANFGSNWYWPMTIYTITYHHYTSYLWLTIKPLHINHIPSLSINGYHECYGLSMIECCSFLATLNSVHQASYWHPVAAANACICENQMIRGRLMAATGHNNSMILSSYENSDWPTSAIPLGLWHCF